MRLFINGKDVNTDLYVRSQLSDIEIREHIYYKSGYMSKAGYDAEIIHNA